jgi:hypothetical protein
MKKSKTRPPPLTLLTVLMFTTAGDTLWAKSAKEGTPPTIGASVFAEIGWVQFKLAAMINPATRDSMETPARDQKYLPLKNVLPINTPPNSEGSQPKASGPGPGFH